MRHRAEDATHHPVHRRHPMAQPDGHGLGLGAKGGFGFECGATARPEILI
jgi:hypothetical protein